MSDNMRIKEDIIVKGEKVALFIPNIKTEKRIEFFTDAEDQLQIAAFNMKEGQRIQPHVHLKNERMLEKTVEIIFVQKGQMSVTFHESEEDKTVLESVVMNPGDVIFLKSGIHGFIIDKDCKFLEFKQGPFTESIDKKKLYNQ
jgi:quercetin dioxygenase-like cupin family protein